MKKNVFKKIVAGAMAVATMATAVFGMVGCKKDEKTAFMIGGTGPLTGDAASYGVSVQNGATLAVEQINAKGGIQFTFKMMDDQCGAEQASANYDVLYDDGMQISLGGVTSGAGKAFSTKANADQIISMSPSASADDVIANMPYSFRLCFGDPDQGALAAKAIKDAGYASVGAIYDTSDPYSEGIFTAFKAAMDSYSITVNTQTFDAESKVDFSTQAEALKNCDVIFMPFYYNEAQLFIKKAVEKGCTGVFFGCDGFDGIASYISADITNTIIYSTPFDVNSSEANVKAFVEAYKARFGFEPDQFAADAYDVVMVFAAALEKAGVTDYNLSAAEISTAVKDAITSGDFSYTGLTGNNMTWSADGKCKKDPKFVTING